MKNLLILVAILAIAVVLILTFSGTPSDLETDGTVAQESAQELEGLDLNDLDAEFDAIDADLQTL